MKKLPSLVAGAVLALAVLACRGGAPADRMEAAQQPPGSEETPVVQVQTGADLSVGDAEAPVASPNTPEEVLSAYHNALKDGKFEEAVSLFSDFSLNAAGVSRDDIVLVLEKAVFERDWRLKEYRIVDVNERADLGIAVARIWTRESWKENGQLQEGTYDLQWVLAHLDDDRWVINYSNFVDIYECDIPTQEHEGLAIRPWIITRTLDRTRVVFEATNLSQRIARWGWVPTEPARLTTSAGIYSLHNAGLKILPGRTYPDAYFEFGQWVEGEPLALMMGEWVWLNDNGLPDNDPSWSYEFELEGKCTRRSAADDR